MTKKKVIKKSKVKKLAHEGEDQDELFERIERTKKVFKTERQIEITLDLNEPLYLDYDTAAHLVIGKPYLISKFQDYMRSLGDDVSDFDELTYLVRHGSPDGIKIVENYQEELPSDKC